MDKDIEFYRRTKSGPKEEGTYLHLTRVNSCLQNCTLKESNLLFQEDIDLFELSLSQE